MKAIRAKIAKGGRIVIPAAFRQRLHLEAGDDIIIHMSDNTIYLSTVELALRKLQSKVMDRIKSTGKNVSLVDELIAERRKEATRE